MLSVGKTPALVSNRMLDAWSLKFGKRLVSVAIRSQLHIQKKRRSFLLHCIPDCVEGTIENPLTNSSATRAFVCNVFMYTKNRLFV